MKKQDLLNRRVRDLKIGPETTIRELMESFRDIGGFTAAKVRNGYDILKKMFSEENTTFLSFPADIISTGTRGIINDLVKKKLVDVIITTNGMLDHDIAYDVFHLSCTYDCNSSSCNFPAVPSHIKVKFSVLTLSGLNSKFPEGTTNFDNGIGNDCRNYGKVQKIKNH